MKAIGPHEMVMAVRIVAGGGMLYSAFFLLRAVRKRMYFDSNSDISQALEQSAIWLSHHLYQGRDLIVGGWLKIAVHTS